MTDFLRQVIASNRAGAAVAIPSVCSAHPDVLGAALLRARALGRPLVIEATSNQVNQEGGYTGMRPADFVTFVHDIGTACGVDMGQVILGGDHLGPQAWRRCPADQAMDMARIMVADYVRAGFTKIHLDCSEGCAGEPARLDDLTAAARAADLASICLGATADPERLLFVIGTEVPPPGGADSDDHGDITPTRPEAACATLMAHRAAFEAAGIGAHWAKVGALVVQPGVEFTPMQVHHLPLDRDPALKTALTDWPRICLEAHSTDYQHPEAFPRLAELGFAFQKVGPALTFAWREAIYALDTLRRLAGWARGGTIPEVMEELMQVDPTAWQRHYHGTSDAQHLMRHFALADRIRYYWTEPEAQAAVADLFTDLKGRELPRPFLSQAFARDVIDRAEALLDAYDGNQSRALVAAAVQRALDPYFF